MVPAGGRWASLAVVVKIVSGFPVVSEFLETSETWKHRNRLASSYLNILDRMFSSHYESVSTVSAGFVGFRRSPRGFRDTISKFLSFRQ